MKKNQISVYSMSFLSPVRVGHLLTLRAKVNWIGKSSIEVGVRLEAENPVTGEIAHTNSAFAVFVALDGAGVACLSGTAFGAAGEGY